VPRLVFLGAGGHAAVLHALALACEASIIGVCDPALVASGLRHWRDVQVLGDDCALTELDRDSVLIVNAIGQTARSTRRREACARVKALGFQIATLIHPTAWIADDVGIGEGVQVMAGAIVQPGCRIGDSTIINTRVSIDHDCQVASHVHIAPGATLCGRVRIGEGAFIGAGTTVIDGISVGAGALVAAGSTLFRPVPDGAVSIPRLGNR
jgi:sugar O-acyltransferase (sialic acid O-acetyltransferase NeuD family)